MNKRWETRISMKHLTDNQLMYRAYLCTPLWKSKREEALKHHGCICARCGDYGSDVHHKTYERVGGDELMDDFEILCRECHEAHHEAERCATREKGIRMIHRRAIYEKLSGKHAKILLEEFPEIENLYMSINFGRTEISDMAAKLLGCDFSYGKPPKVQSLANKYGGSGKISYCGTDGCEESRRYNGVAFKYDRCAGSWKRVKDFEELFNFLLTRI